jgi:hypothetical protein
MAVAAPSFASTQGRSGDRSRAHLERALADRDGWLCFYCGTDDFFGGRCVDHVTARSRGGSDDLTNLVFACRNCNLLKGTAPAWFFAFWRAARRPGPENNKRRAGSPLGDREGSRSAGGKT